MVSITVEDDEILEKPIRYHSPRKEPSPGDGSPVARESMALYQSNASIASAQASAMPNPDIDRKQVQRRGKGYF